jgi:hypothetical protein
MTNAPRERFRPILEAEPGEPPPIILLRKLLKVAVRVCGRRCLEVASAPLPASSSGESTTALTETAGERSTSG